MRWRTRKESSPATDCQFARHEEQRPRVRSSPVGLTHAPIPLRYKCTRAGASVDCSDLTPKQAEKIRDALIPYVRYPYRLQQRMRLREFPGGDPLVLLTDRACTAAGDLAEQLQRMACVNGITPAAIPKDRDGPKRPTVGQIAERDRRLKPCGGVTE
jgi:hypothetical protein